MTKILAVQRPSFVLSQSSIGVAMFVLLQFFFSIATALKITRLYSRLAQNVVRLVTNREAARKADLRFNDCLPSNTCQRTGFVNDSHKFNERYAINLENLLL